jgi:hypothetical protein
MCAPLVIGSGPGEMIADDKHDHNDDRRSNNDCNLIDRIGEMRIRSRVVSHVTKRRSEAQGENEILNKRRSSMDE